MTQTTKILIVEDNKGHSILLERKLKALKIYNSICLFSTGTDFLDFVFRRNTYSEYDADENYLIFLDIRLPELSGLEILEILKKDKKTKHFPVIMISSSNDPNEIARGQKSGSLGFLHKPASSEQIKELLMFCKNIINIIE